MDKTKQQLLTAWLKQQKGPAQQWLRLLTLLNIINGLIIVAQAWLLATVLHNLIIEQVDRESLTPYFFGLVAAVFSRALLSWLKEKISFLCGEAVRKNIRKLVLDRLEQLGPVWIKGKPAGSWATIILEQIEDIQDYYSRYLPQITLAAIIPLFILAAIIPTNWAAGVILMITAPLIPLFMILIGNGAAEANRRNFTALARLSGNFLDRLKGIDTLRLFHQGVNEIKQVQTASENFRRRTMDVLKLAFLSSALLEFFTSVSIAVVAVYFGFSYLGELNFGHYGKGVTLFAGFLVLILAPEFFQPLRDLGTFYHAKAQAVAAAGSLVDFLQHENTQSGPEANHQNSNNDITGDNVTIIADELIIMSHTGNQLAGPLSFTLKDADNVILVGRSGAGKSSLVNVLLGFLPYKGSLTINGIELKNVAIESWRKRLSWVGQNPYLPENTIRENILLASPNASEQQLAIAIDKAYVNEFINRLPDGLETKIGENAARLSVGQAQRIAVARALLMPCELLLLDEPTASLDARSEALVMKSLSEASRHQKTIMITHHLNGLSHHDIIWVMENGAIVQQGSYQQLSQADGPFARLLASRNAEV